MTHETADIIHELSTMPGMMAQFRHGFTPQRFQDIHGDSVVRWMTDRGLIDRHLGHYWTPAAFLCTPRRFHRVAITPQCIEIIRNLQK